MRRFAVLLGVLLTVAFSAGAPPDAQARSVAARPWPPRPAPLVSMSLVDHEGMALRTVMHHGRTFVAGERGQRYAVALTNNTAQRLEVVVTVDGRDVVTGRRGDVRRQRGYVLAPFQTIEIEGFRTSLARVAAFRFADVPDSYAARRGHARDAGTIGVAVFQEKRRPMMKKAPSAARGGAAPSAPRTSDDRSRQELGTEFGEGRTSVVREVAFVRMNPSRPDFSTALFYDSAHGLAARGIPIDPEPLEVVDPRVSDSRFAPPPRPR
jgi:hypothetical protein